MSTRWTLLFASSYQAGEFRSFAWLVCGYLNLELLSQFLVARATRHCRYSCPAQRYWLKKACTAAAAVHAFCLFFSKIAARRLEAEAPTNELPVLGSNFFHLFGASRLIDVGVLVSCPCKVIPLSRTKMRFKIWSRKWKDKFAHQQWWNIHGIQNRLAELHGSILSCPLGPVIIQDSRSFRCSCVYFPTQCNIHYKNPSIVTPDTCWARFVWKDTRPPIFSPQQNGAKNHWIAWQCTFNWGFPLKNGKNNNVK